MPLFVLAGLCGDDCAMVLCAPTTYSESGRQPSKDEYCKHCSGAIYWGATFCHGSTPTRQPVSVSAFEGASSTGVSVSEADIDKIKLIYESCGGECHCVPCSSRQSHLLHSSHLTADYHTSFLIEISIIAR